VNIKLIQNFSFQLLMTLASIAYSNADSGGYGGGGGYGGERYGGCVRLRIWWGTWPWSQQQK
jgi:hypothetical protein